MKFFKNALAIFAIGAALALPATAQTPSITGNEFQTGTGGKVAPGYVQMCLNASNVAVPCGGSQAAPLVVTGSTNIPTYSAAVTGLANVAAGDLYCVIGSATKIVKVKGIRLSAVATAAIVGDVSIVLRSTLDTGGGLASVPVVKMDQLNAAPTATVNSFTSAPTPGTAIGTVRSRKIAAGTQGNAAITSEGLFQFSVYWDQPVILRGITQAVCVNVSAFGAGASFDIDHEHTEE